MNNPFNRQQWLTVNYELLMQEVLQVTDKLQSYLTSISAESDLPTPNSTADNTIGQGAPVLNDLCRFFSLSQFERQLLLLCLAAELDPQVSVICAKSGQPYPTLNLALSLFDGPRMTLNPTSPLRYYALIEQIDNGNGFAHQALKLSPWTLFYLTENISDEPWLKNRLKPASSTVAELDSQRRDADSLWQALRDQVRPLCPLSAERATFLLSVPQLVSTDVPGAVEVAAIASNQGDLHLYTLDLRVLPQCHEELDIFQRLLERELIISQSIIFIDCNCLLNTKTSCDLVHRLSVFVDTLVGHMPGRCVLYADQPLSLFSFLVQGIYLKELSTEEQLELWNKNLTCYADNLSREDGDTTYQSCLQQLSAHFSLKSRQISDIARRAKNDAKITGKSLTSLLWQFCREQNRQQLHGLARIIAPGRNCWDQIVLPPVEQKSLRNMITQVSQRRRVYQQWAFERHFGYGSGICALFAGGSGTGKTLAARVIASELGLDIYQIDLSNVADKYIGETEKNLERIFSAAERSGAILLFDEADALFGKRTKVTDSRDRHANMGVSFLLQRMESYSGLSILTTNQASSMDEAFVRRLRFIVQFPFPSEQERFHIWNRVFPPSAPTLALEYHKLARLSISGGVIRNIALQAAFYAAGEDQPIGMKHILEATRQDYIKAEKTLREDLVHDWLSDSKV